MIGLTQESSSTSHRDPKHVVYRTPCHGEWNCCSWQRTWRYRRSIIHLDVLIILKLDAGVIYPIVLYRLQPRIGFGWATRAIGFIALVTLTFSASVMRSKSLPPAARQFFDIGALKNVPFNLTNLGNFFIFTGLYIPLFYVC